MKSARRRWNIDVASQIAAALSAAPEAGIAHRDIARDGYAYVDVELVEATRRHSICADYFE
jgi:hypothetical protein